MDRKRLKQLKEQNRLNLRRKKWEKNRLLQECIKKLQEVFILENEEQIQEVFVLIHKKFPNTTYSSLNDVCEINLLPAQSYYILWDNAELPIIESSGKYIDACFEEIFAVSFDTWIIDKNFTECFHIDDRNNIGHSLGRIAP